MNLMKKILFLLVFLTAFFTVFSQDRVRSTTSGDMDYLKPKEYEIGGVTVSGTRYLDNGALITLSGLTVGDKIKVPGEEISKAIQNLWKQELFDDIRIDITRIQGNLVFLDIVLSERPRLSRFSFTGIKKTDADELREKIKLVKGKIVNENLLNNTSNIVKRYYRDKGFLNADVKIIQEPDTILSNSVMLRIDIDKKTRIKINEVIVNGNTALKDKKVKRLLKDTKEKSWYNIFGSSKYLAKNFQEDQKKVIAKYNELGYRDAKVVRDTVYRFNEKTVNVELDIYEGPKYYFGNITFVGNTKHSTAALNNILGLKKGDVYNQQVLDTRLNMNPNGRDISSLYLDDGYLFFTVTPVEKLVYNDTIDLEINIREGAQATINKIIVKGNDKTNDKVILREIRTKPGQKFSRSEIIRTQRELAQLGYFDPEKLGVTPKPDPVNGMVDIEYTVEERPSDQIELSGGFGGGRIVGTLGVSINNFSLKNLLKGDFAGGIPSGDGQRISLRGQTYGLSYQSYNISFSEPWLGGKKPNYFTVSAFRTTQSNGKPKGDEDRQSIGINGVSFGLGKRLQFPDDYFVLNSSISFQQYQLNNYGGFVFDKGNSYNISLTEVLSRNSIDQPIYPRSGSLLSLTIQLTPPYSLANGVDYSDISNEEKYKFIEYHKWKFDASWFTKIVGNLVLNSKVQFGFLGFYNSDIGISPFERYKLGGDGLTGFDFLAGSEVIGLRGYPNNSVIPNTNFRTVGSPIFNKAVLELRYPLTMNPSATIYMLTFVEGGNTYANFRDFNPYNFKRSAGVGARIFLPVFGLLGLDYGYGFDDIPGLLRESRGEFHFSIGQTF